jgi:integrase
MKQNIERKKKQKSENEDFYRKYSTVERWITSVLNDGTGSDSTKYQYLRLLRGFCEWVGKDPDKLIEERKRELKNKDESVRRRAEESLSRYFNELERVRGKSRNTCVMITTVIRSFYKANYVPLVMKTPRVWAQRSDKVPTLEEVKKMVDVSETPLQRALIIFSAQSGQRLGIIRALTYSMVKDSLEKSVPFLHIDVSAGLEDKSEVKVNKRRVEYSFFVGQDSIEALKAYLQSRKAAGDRIKDSSLLFVSEKKWIGKFVPLDAEAINNYVKRAAFKSGLMSPIEKGTKEKPGMYPIHHHCLRKFWQTAMEAAGVAKPWYEYMMGHKRPKLDRSYSHPTIDQMKEAYKKAEPYLSVSAVSRPATDDIKKELLLSVMREQAKIFGIDPVRLRIERSKEIRREITPDEEVEAIRDGIIKLRTEPMKLTNGGNNCNKYESKMISEEALAEHIEDGWDIVRELRDGRIAIKRLKES